MVQNQNLKRRISKIEERFGLGQNDEIVEFPMDNGEIFRSTRRELNRFLEWLKGRENNGQETIETA